MNITIKTRQILFRGKSIDNGRWVIGDLFHRKGVPSPSITPMQIGTSGVVKETVGQFTGERDINMTMVYEHDLLRVPETLSNAELLCAVTFKFGRYVGISVSSNTTWDLEYLLHLNAVVVGNTHDNPDKAPNFTIE